MEKMPQCSVEKEFERLRGNDIVTRVEAQDFSEEICEWGLRAFISVTGAAMQAQNTDSMADFLDDGGCEALITIMNKHAVANADLAAKGCLVLCILTWSLRELKEFLGEIGACELAVFVTSVHIGDPEVSEHGSGAIALLAKNNIANSLRLAQAGACDVIAQVGNFGFNLQHERCQAVARNVCMAIALLSEAANASKLLECGAAGLITALVRFHEDSEEFTAAAMKALCGLSSLSAQLREELGKSGACAAVLSLLGKHYETITITQDACEAIMHLSLSPTNSEKLGAGGGCEAVVEALDQKLMDHDFGAEVCTCAILNLCLYGTGAKDSRTKFVETGTIDLLRRTQHNKKTSYRARENILKLLELLGADNVPGSISHSGSFSANLNAVGGNRSRNNSSLLTDALRGVGTRDGKGKSRSRTSSSNSSYGGSEAEGASWVGAGTRGAGASDIGDSVGGSGRHRLGSAGAELSSQDDLAVRTSREESTVGGVRSRAGSAAPTATLAGIAAIGDFSAAGGGGGGGGRGSSTSIGSSANNGNSNVGNVGKALKGQLVGVVHGSEMKGDTVPLQVEIRETLVEYDSLEQLMGSDKKTLHPSAAAAAAAAAAAEKRAEERGGAVRGAGVAGEAGVVVQGQRNRNANKAGDKDVVPAAKSEARRAGATGVEDVGRSGAVVALSAHLEGEADENEGDGGEYEENEDEDRNATGVVDSTDVDDFDYSFGAEPRDSSYSGIMRNSEGVYEI